ncbi:MAG: alpha/beta hydrolase [Candidatus Limosilactobacillus intestinavium]
MKKLRMIGGLLLFALMITVSFGFTKRNQNQWVNSKTPTIFVHGYGSSYNAEKYMVNHARKAGVTSTVVLARVDKNGSVKLSGPSIKNKRNPIVEVNLANNKQVDMNEGARYINNVVLALQKRDGIKSYNFVAHSMGNMDVFAYLSKYGSQSNAPKLKKQVVLAGGGLGGWGNDNRMSSSMKDLMGQLKDNYPHAKVLNIAGNSGQGTDGRVPNSASRSVKAMLGDRPQSYHYVLYEGSQYTHSNLHENAKVANRINQFLWGK